MPSSTPQHPIVGGLNDAQRRAVTSDAATVAILAGPGSGKTHTLTARVVWLVDHVGFRPEDVIVATFTVKAAREMKERIGKALGGGRENRIVLGTFHSIARRYLAAYGRHIGLSQKFGIGDDADSRAIIGRICQRLQLGIDPVAARAWISKKKARGTDAAPSKSARQEAAAKNPGLQHLEQCYREYQDQLQRSNLLDYDDLLVRCVELLRKFPACVSNVQAVLIDEYQDTNGVQYELMKLFAQRHRRITIVGDPDQSIYGWRSAEIRNLWRLLREFPDTDEVSLEENYRSSQSILDLSLLVIQQDKKRYQKALKPTHNKGSRPVLRKLKSASAEADWVVSEIKRVMMMSGSMLTHDDVAILLRSAALSRHIESSLGKAGIAYRMVGGHKFYDRTEIKILLDYLRVIHQPENNDALARILNVPQRGVGKVTIGRLLEEAETSSLSVWAVLWKHCRGDRIAKTNLTKPAEQKLSGSLLRPLEDIRKRIREASGPNGTPFGLVQMIEQLLTTLNFQKHLQKEYADDHEQRWANVEEFISLAADFVREMGRADDDALPEIEGVQQTREVEALPRFLATVALASDAQTGGDNQDNKPLGLEWPVVFVPAVYNGSMPHMRAEDADEERRLLYVAMTRAQSLLYLSYPLSPFVEPVSGSFLKKGPCFDRPRKLPPEDSIFKNLPAMFSPEDNLFPVDPEESREGQPAEDASRVKRPRLHGPSAGQAHGEETQWRREYTTTLEQSLASTVASLPGFVSVGSHQAAITAANVPSEPAQKAEKIKRSSSRRPADQKSIVGFVRTTSGSARPAAARPPENAKPNDAIPARKPFAVQQPQAIDPGLAGHKLGRGKLMTRPSVPNEEKTARQAQYACFSSPPRPAAKEGGKGNKPVKPNNVEPPPQQTRTGGSLHATTFNIPKGLGSAIKRPTGLSLERITPIERLRKPFKPLTINRS
ncbi:P-loop containing nucleoside triphosphate hydrolase protein [Chaetomium strumarium]|uniref:DNA 3'-5' helicase n=1 Tax=Chaetomium strumarium TaxID=1170767 RepID=A0AAJ0GNT1_9PEZI|nr:P-loop containing nucleoside triphosphate hydrolase protein [Chaetomium strumarium]